MTENEHKKTLPEKVFELLQWVILGGLYLRKPGQAGGNIDQDDHEMPGWLLSILAPFTDDDEVIYAQLLDTLGFNEQEKIDSFRLVLIANGWDEDVFRIRLVKNFKDALGKKTLMKNSATLTLQQLVEADGDYPKQERIALSKKILEKVSGRKKFFRWISTHKLEVLVGIFIIPLGFFELIIWLLS